MKTLTIITAVMALALTAGEASARQRQHVPEYQTHQYAPPSEYESLSQGRQFYPNPDRQLYVQQGAS
jgi:hypothetical protein